MGFVIFLKFFKVGPLPSKKNCFFCFNESPFKWWKMHFISVLKILKIWSWFFRHVEKQLDSEYKVNFKIYGVTTWLKNNYSVLILPAISRSKVIQIMTFGLLIEYNMTNIFLQKSCRKWNRVVPYLFLFFLKKWGKSKWSAA